MKPEEYEGEMIDPRGPDETPEQIAERLAVVICPHRLGCIRYACDEEDLPTDCDCEHGVVRAVILQLAQELQNQLDAREGRGISR